MENELAFKGNCQDLPLSSSYEAAMEALSSLITRQKRGDRTPVAGKFGKLERMSIYLRIRDKEGAGLELPPAFVRGLSTARISGRAQIVHDNGSADTSENSVELTFYLDGAHSPENVSLDKSSKTDSVDSLPPHDFLYADVSHGSLADQNFASSAGMPSLPLTIKWLRDCVKEKPSLRLQVLVTGSLHLVGDVLKLLRR
ncbi:hypothetical protein NL676_016512 [Syzygium grande]|nr:hypothetical protein NL676_016512 [Syzygium grande]